MEKYDYYDAVKEDVLKAIEEDDKLLPRKDEDATDYEWRLTDAFWASGVTGNGSYAYYYSDEEDAITAVMTNLDLCREAFQELEIDVDAVTLMSNIRSADVTIRCYILPSVIHDIIEEKSWFNDKEGRINYGF